MGREEYEQKRDENWLFFAASLGIDPQDKAQKVAFDRAYALGKQEKDSDKEEMFTCEKSKVLYRFRMAEACKIGNNPETDYH